MCGDDGVVLKPTACEEDAGELGDEESEADSEGREEGSPVFLRRQHQDDKDQLSGEEHLDDFGRRSALKARFSLDGVTYRRREPSPWWR